MHRLHRLRHLPAAALLVGLAGCGGDGLRRVDVRGRVTAQGAPVPNATVLFLPADGTQGEGGIGTTDQDGRFTLTGSRGGASGVVPGKYRVRVSRFVNPDGSPLPPDFTEAEYPRATESVPAPYSGPDSPLEVTVPDKGGEVNVEIPAKLRGKK